ncbi:MAG TPA: hypothetical protein VGJ73_05210, partial [Verrucomicrobiae bacterium]
RRSDSRSRAASQMAAEFKTILPRAALTDSLALGYIYFTPTGLQIASADGRPDWERENHRQMVWCDLGCEPRWKIVPRNS